MIIDIMWLGRKGEGGPFGFVHSQLFAAQENFSNSLVIHQAKTKKITSVKEVWIPDLN